MHILRIDHIVLTVTEVEHSCRFYEQVLRPRCAFDHPAAPSPHGSAESRTTCVS